MKLLIEGILPICSIMMVSCAAYPQTAWASEGADRGQITIRVSVMPRSKADFESQVSRLGSKDNLRQLCQSAQALSQLELAALDGRHLNEPASDACEITAIGEVSPEPRHKRTELQTVLIRPI